MWDTLLENAARCGMSERDFCFATPRWLAARQKAWSEGVQREWEQAQLISFFIVKTVDSKNRIRSPESLIRFPWQKLQKVEFEPITKEELDRFSDEADKILEKTNPEAYKRYMAIKNQPQQQEQDFTPSGELDF